MAGSRDRDRNRERDRDRHRDSDRDRSFRHSLGHNSHSRRSPDYCRNDNNSEEDNNFDNNSRRHRSHQDYDRYDSDRRHHRRDRSRSRDRDRDRDREVRERDSTANRYYNDEYDTNYQNEDNEDIEYTNESYDGERDKDRERTHYQRDKREEIPNNTIMIRGLAAHICESDIVAKLAEHSLQAKDIRLMRKKETGVSRGFAFIEFSNIESAIQWKEVTQGIVIFNDEYESTIHYSIPKDSFSGDRNIMKNDWTCYKCGVNNFKRREECFKCGTPKEESEANDTGEEISLTPTNALLLRNLSPNTTEERILTILGTITALPIKSIRILKDPTYNISRGMCLVELHTTLEASQLFTLLSSMNLGFIIDDYPVTVSYGKRNVSLANSINTSNTNAAIVALAAAQWRNLDDNQYAKSVNDSNSFTAKESDTVKVKGVEYQKYQTPVVSSFQYDESSGYYYDTNTGFYYDSNTQYYYKSQTQQYMYWEPKYSTYLPVDKVPQTSEEEKQTKDPKQDKVKIAKKIAKDMEKWAKTLNQKKETARSWSTISEPILSVETTHSIKNSTADAGFSLLEQQVSQQTDTELLTYETMQQLRATELKAVNIGDKNQLTVHPYDIIKAEEKKLTDWDKMACLLCKRQFSSAELLTKHQQISDLHKNNLMILKRTKLSDEQIEELEQSEREAGYRDRAKERRKKYGIPETPEMSKLKSKYLTEMQVRSSTIKTPIHKAQEPISEDNIGNKMLKAMGWTEGTGLGKKNQGMSNIIEVERRKEGVGLGINASTFAGESYKDAVRRTMQQRFKELNE